jgi:hypothetical protein
MNKSKEIRRVLLRACSHGACLLVLLLHLALALGLTAETPGPEFQAAIDRREIKIGDLVHLRLALSVPEGWQIQTPSWQPQLGEWKLRGASILPVTRTNTDWKWVGFDLEVAIYKIGEFEIPSLEASFISSSGEKNSLKSNPLKIRVTSVLPAGKQEIKELKPQLELPPDYLWLYLLLGFLLVLAVGSYLLYRFYLRRRKPAPPEPLLEIPPDQEALTAIERLLSRGLIREGKFKEFYLELSEIVKKYLESRLQVTALERTTEEFLRDLESVALPCQVRHTIHRFLENCDWVKFAKYIPEEAETSCSVNQSRQIIEETEIFLKPPVLPGAPRKA